MFHVVNTNINKGEAGGKNQKDALADSHFLSHYPSVGIFSRREVQLTARARHHLHDDAFLHSVFCRQKQTPLYERILDQGKWPNQKNLEKKE